MAPFSAKKRCCPSGAQARASAKARDSRDLSNSRGCPPATGATFKTVVFVALSQELTASHFPSRDSAKTGSGNMGCSLPVARSRNRTGLEG